MENLQSLVKGRIEILPFRGKGFRSIIFVFNEECKFVDGEEVNKILIYRNNYQDFIEGNIFVIAADIITSKFVSLTDEEITFYLEYLKRDFLFFE